MDYFRFENNVLVHEIDPADYCEYLIFIFDDMVCDKQNKIWEYLPCVDRKV